MGINYNELREILERKANKAINHLDELKCFVPEFREVLDSVLYISETLKDLMFLDTECPDCKKEAKPNPTPTPNQPAGRPTKEDYIGKPYTSLMGEDRPSDRLVMFYSNTCKPCQFLKPILEEYVVEHKLSLDLVLVDEPEGREHAEKNNVQGWPLVFILKNNIVQHVLMGADINSPVEVTKNRLKEELTPFFK